ncbi:group III truncated hemoglobin [Mucilaginibacter sp. 14171R-50]|uniref:group III truncated hemoglobin n=1 Tax=Mucilaginibacter sp. 14171R-50 TaxID=2703789 RepID=UPI00138C708B|nr:group III truncated hemoglobin [Mucilaginibacter sp. 14171R-50]QHS56595.1 group III truncated hemoglobin [Mucilaginibacter sp. 14171R-50]
METQLHDMETEADVRLLVDAFYGKVRQDELLAPVFEPVIGGNWDHHLARMADFWSTLLLYTKKFSDDPLTRHLPLVLTKAHFDRWLMLFHGTVDELFQGDIAENAKKRAYSIARIMKAVKNINQ